jgi:hypothetical protein
MLRPEYYIWVPQCWCSEATQAYSQWSLLISFWEYVLCPLTCLSSIFMKWHVAHLRRLRKKLLNFDGADLLSIICSTTLQAFKLQMAISVFWLRFPNVKCRDLWDSSSTWWLCTPDVRHSLFAMDSRWYWWCWPFRHSVGSLSDSNQQFQHNKFS